ncbi:Isopenicillin N synthase [Geosmithia morbida]|uniref:Isopenicillin N synthase n=1 Tax=Geosmithia morbida TaxID=1094350 RepID=A0A9P5D1A1_9HYPO|nr:Isopenicillin N synthase [Geosmithia morbida]KAF4123663.1 Isopenicillin N synthase [Geosmithia morbida]
MMAPSALPPQEHVTFHAGKGKQTRPVLTGSSMKPTFDAIPVVDLSKARSCDLADRQSVAREIGRAFTEVGFMYAVNHGIGEDVQTRVRDVVEAFFALDPAEKMKVHINRSATIRGYEALLETRLDDRTRGDMKEAFNMADDPYEAEQRAPADLDMSAYPAADRGPTGSLNQWPDLPPSFRRSMYEYRAAAQGVASTLLRLTALALDLPEAYFDGMARFPMAGLRALHYPPQGRDRDGDGGAVGIGAHADYSWFTLVNQLTPDAAGLEVLDANGHWVSVPPLEGSLVVNVGDFLERATNDRFVSTVHRVRNNDGRGVHRYSLAYFFSPTHDVLIRTLPTCLGEGGDRKYDDIRAREWQQQRLLRARTKHPASILAKERGEI